MRMYNSDLSPFASRCRMAAYAKDIDIETLDPPGGLASDEYKKINPTGKIPALEDNGKLIAESEVICEYLDDKFADKPLRPDNAAGRAAARLLSRVCDLYILGPFFPLLPHLNPKRRDQAVVDAGVAEVKKGLNLLESYFRGDGYAVGDRLSIADCTLVPTLFFMHNFLPAFGLENPLNGRPKLMAYWEKIQKDPVAARVLKEMADELKRRRGG